MRFTLQILHTEVWRNFQQWTSPVLSFQFRRWPFWIRFDEGNICHSNVNMYLSQLLAQLQEQISEECIHSSYCMKVNWHHETSLATLITNNSELHQFVLPVQLLHQFFHLIGRNRTHFQLWFHLTLYLMDLLQMKKMYCYVGFVFTKAGAPAQTRSISFLPHSN